MQLSRSCHQHPLRSALLLAAAALASVIAITLPSSSPATAAALAAATPSCATSGLVIWLSEVPGGGTAGSIYYKLELTNLSGHTCTLLGYPGVSAVNLAGRQLGAGAMRETARRPRLVTLVSGTPTLANGTTASAVLRIIDAGVEPSCRPVTAAGLRVYPPGQSSSKMVPFPFQSCSRAGRSNLAVQALTPVR
jgi:Protein of unknown function (DUF4232)